MFDWHCEVLHDHFTSTVVFFQNICGIIDSVVKAHIFVNFNVCFKRHTCCAHGCWTWQQKMVVNFQYEQNCFSSKMWSFSLMFIHTKFRDYYHQFKHRNNFVQDFIRSKIKNFHTKLIFCVIACLIYEIKKKRLTTNIVLIELLANLLAYSFENLSMTCIFWLNVSL